MSLRGHYQNAYVTHDLDKAIDLTGSLFGLGDFSSLDIDLVATTPDGQRTSRLRVATAWAGLHQVELIQPVSGYLEPYLHALPSDSSDAVPRLHHVAVRRENLSDMTREARALGLPIAFESGGGGINCIFVDARNRLGHFLEFVTASEEGWALVGWPKS